MLLFCLAEVFDKLSSNQKLCLYTYLPLNYGHSAFFQHLRKRRYSVSVQIRINDIYKMLSHCYRSRKSGIRPENVQIKGKSVK
jgi:hypothetical protein